MVEHWESCECRKCDQKRIADLRAENERLHDELRQGRDYQTYIYTIQKRDAEIADLKAEIERLRSIIDTLTATAPATASLAVFLCSRCRESVDTVYESGSGANVEHVCKNCVDAGGDDE